MCAAPADACARCRALEAVLVDPAEALRRVDPDAVRLALTAADFKSPYLGEAEGEVWFRPHFDGVRMPDGFGRQQKNEEGLRRLRVAVNMLANATNRHPNLVLADLVVASELGRW